MRACIFSLFFFTLASIAHASETVEFHYNNNTGNERDEWKSRFPNSPNDAKSPNGTHLGNYSVQSTQEPYRSFKVDTWIDSGFHSGQPEAIEKAPKFMLANFLTDRVWDCALRDGLEIPDVSVEETKLALFKAFAEENKTRGLYITRFWYRDTGIRGLALLRWFDWTETRPNGSGEFWITINSVWNEPISNAEIKNRAGVIFHEILHNIGLTHPSYSKNFNNRNELIYRLHDCLVSRGRF